MTVSKTKVLSNFGINGKRNKPQFEKRSKVDNLPDVTLVQDELHLGLNDGLRATYTKFKGRNALDWINYIELCIKNQRYEELQQYILSCHYDSDSLRLTDLEGLWVSFESAKALKYFRFFCFIVEIYKRKQDILSFELLISNHSQNDINHENFILSFFEPNLYYGTVFSDSIDYYMSGKNPFDRVYEAMKIDYENKVIH